MAKRIYNQVSLFGPQYAFLIVLSPPDFVKNDVASFKKQLNAISGISVENLHAIAHITLTERLSDDASLADTVSEILKNEKQFTIKIKGWNIFDHKHSITLYLNIETPESINRIASLLKSSNKKPHVSLAKRISYETYDKLKPWLANFNYHAEWVCIEVVVLRKLMSEKHLGFRDAFTIPLKQK